jgi:membrane protein YqaA with SNARE-associated domain
MARRPPPEQRVEDDHEVLHKLMKRLCFVALAACVLGVILQYAIGGVLPFVIAAGAAALGFISGYQWSRRRRHEDRRE